MTQTPAPATTSSGVLFAAVGDVFLDRPDPADAFAEVDHLLHGAPTDVGVIPCTIAPDGKPRSHHAQDPDGARVWTT